MSGSIWAIQQRLQALLAERKIMLEVVRRPSAGSPRRGSGPGYEPPERFARRLGAHEFAEGPRPLPSLAPDPRLCHDVNGSPSSWT